MYSRLYKIYGNKKKKKIEKWGKRVEKSPSFNIWRFMFNGKNANATIYNR